MNPLGAAAVLVAGILLGALVAWLLLRRPASEETPTFDDPPPPVPDGVSEILSVLSASGVVVAGRLSPAQTQRHWRTVVEAGVDRGQPLVEGVCGARPVQADDEGEAELRGVGPVQVLQLR